MTEFDPTAQTGGPIEGTGRVPRSERRRNRGRSSTTPPAYVTRVVNADAGFWRRLLDWLMT